MSDVYFSLFVHAILAEDCLDFSFGQITMEKIKQMFFSTNELSVQIREDALFVEDAHIELSEKKARLSQGWTTSQRKSAHTHADVSRLTFNWSDKSLPW